MSEMQYCQTWTDDYGELADVDLVAAGGQRFRAHAAVLGSPVVSGMVVGTGKKQTEVVLEVSAETVEAIMEMVYIEDYKKAYYNVDLGELLDTLDFLGCERILEKLCERMCCTMEAWAYGWGVKEYSYADSEKCEFALFDVFDGGVNFVSDQTEWMTHLCIALLGDRSVVLFNKVSRDKNPLITMVRVVRKVFTVSRPGWLTLMSSPMWDSVSGRRVATFVAAVTTPAPPPVAVKPLCFTEATRSVKVSLTVTHEELSRRMVKMIEIDPAWSIKCINYDESNPELAHRAYAEVLLVRTPGSKGYSRIEARQNYGRKRKYDGSRLVLCCGEDCRIPGWVWVDEGAIPQNMMNDIKPGDKCVVTATITDFI